MGRRTKYQSFDCPQLILDIESETVKEVIEPEISYLDGPIDNEEEKEEVKSKDVQIEEMLDIFLDKIKLKEGEEQVDDNIGLVDRCYLNSFV